MSNKIRTTLLAAAAVAAFALPALADSATCTVNTDIRLRQTPSKKARVLTVLKKDMQVTADKCAGGWVKVAAKDGRLTGYVGGWALTPFEPAVAASSAVPAAEPAPAVSHREVPSNEKLAMQITELRLNVLAIERDMQDMSKEIKKIKVAIRRKPAAK